MTFFSSVRRFFTAGNLLFVALLAILLFLFVQSFGFLFVSGHSMDPSLADGQFLIGLSATNIPFLEVSRGDIVTVDCPQVDSSIVKRVIGLPGDQLQFTAGQLYINGQLYHEPYIYEPMQDSPLNNTAAFTVPEGHYFIMGDNRNHSYDSRSIGCVSKDQLQYLVYPQHQAYITLGAVAFIGLLFFLPIYLSEALDRRLTTATPATEFS